jgi:hypothetical protein
MDIISTQTGKSVVSAFFNTESTDRVKVLIVRDYFCLLMFISVEGAETD